MTRLGRRFGDRTAYDVIRFGNDRGVHHFSIDANGRAVAFLNGRKDAVRPLDLFQARAESRVYMLDLFGVDAQLAPETEIASSNRIPTDPLSIIDCCSDSVHGRRDAGNP